MSDHLGSEIEKNNEISLWDHFLDHVCIQDLRTHRSLEAAFENFAQTRPTGEALLFPDDELKYFHGITFSQIKVISDRIYFRLFKDPQEKDPELEKLLFLHQSNENKGRIWVALLLERNEDAFFYQLTFSRANFNLFLISPRNSPKVIKSMIEEVGCAVVCCSGRTFPLVAPEIQNSAYFSVILPYLQFDTLRVLISEEKNRSEVAIAATTAAQLLINRRPPAQYTDIRFCLTTSGSTDLPKLVFCSNRYILGNATIGISSGLDGFNYDENRLAFAPLFHTLGFITVWAACLIGAVKVVLPLYKGWPPSVDDILTTLQLSEPSSVTFVPYLLHSLTAALKPDDPKWQILRRVKSVTWGGAHLPPQVVEALIAQKININSAYGTTESGCTMMGLLSEPLIGPYAMRVVDNAPHKFELVDAEQNLYELVFRHDCFTLAEGTRNCDFGYATGDLFAPGPEGLWIFTSRKDDIIIHSTGEKTNPMLFEAALMGLIYVRAAVVCGNNRPMTSCLVEIDWNLASSRSLQEMMDGIYDCVTETNQMMAAPSRLFKPMIYVLPAGVDLPTSSKGFGLRRNVEKLYAGRLDYLYGDFLRASVDDAQAPKFKELTIPQSQMDGVTAIEARVKSAILQGLGIALDKSVTELDNECQTCFLELGMDSQGAIKLRNSVERQLKVEIEPQIAYDYPTVDLMCERLCEELSHKRPKKVAGCDLNVNRDALVQTIADVLEMDPVKLEELADVDLASIGLTVGHATMLKHLINTIVGIRLPPDFFERNKTVSEIVSALNIEEFYQIKVIHDWSESKYLVRRYIRLISGHELDSSMDSKRSPQNRWSTGSVSTAANSADVRRLKRAVKLAKTSRREKSFGAARNRHQEHSRIEDLPPVEEYRVISVPLTNRTSHTLNLRVPAVRASLKGGRDPSSRFRKASLSHPSEGKGPYARSSTWGVSRTSSRSTKSHLISTGNSNLRYHESWNHGRRNSDWFEHLKLHKSDKRDCGNVLARTESNPCRKTKVHLSHRGGGGGDLAYFRFNDQAVLRWINTLLTGHDSRNIFWEGSVKTSSNLKRRGGLFQPPSKMRSQIWARQYVKFFVDFDKDIIAPMDYKVDRVFQARGPYDLASDKNSRRLFLDEKNWKLLEGIPPFNRSSSSVQVF